MNPKALLAIAAEVVSTAAEYSGKLKRIREGMAQLGHSSSPATPLPEIQKEINKLMKTNTVMEHKVKALEEQTKFGASAELATIKHLLQVQLKTVQLANAQANIVVNQLDAISKIDAISKK